jgi:hypothetical protein
MSSMNTATSTRPPATCSTERDLIDLRSQACNSLSAALQLLTDPTNPDTLGRALACAMRATTALKRTCVMAKGGA